ncbi:hypothetical protein QBC40DRAFT_263419 [Triangularia verruculosa]|uniref:Rhodopsin domain-containing protein n=1 Tax=Triangularia verruculosa TaxID=2587418 RepID=A0AAN6XKM7_9PEZI|nr:hypothetical protein QBC40DRAFT_263419 [Triangularia verruculosa]
MTILPRHPPHPNVLDIPTPPLQSAGLFIIFFFTALAVVAFLLRLFSRHKTGQWGLDDAMAACALLFSLLMIGPFYMYLKLGYFGWRQEDVPPTYDPTPAFWWFFLAQLFYNPILAFCKASVLIFLLRLGGQKPGVRMVIYLLNGFNGLQAVAVFFVALLQCLPIEANWDFALKADPNTRCIDNSFHVITSALTLFTDILVVAIPFWIFLGLKMKKAAKVAVLGIFVLGLAVTIIGCVRLNGIIQLFYGEHNGKDPFHDVTVTLSVVEANIAIVTACAPALRPLFRMWMPVLFGGTTERYANKYTPNSKLPYYADQSNTRGANGTGMRGDDVNLKTLKSTKMRDGHTECRSASPSGSEEEIMTYNGIMRTTDVSVQYDGASGFAEAPAPGKSRPSVDYKGADFVAVEEKRTV